MPASKILKSACLVLYRETMSLLFIIFLYCFFLFFEIFFLFLVVRISKVGESIPVKTLNDKIFEFSGCPAQESR